jgi:hypothetical protein
MGSRNSKLRDFEKRFARMKVEELRTWHAYFLRNAQAFAPKIKKLAMKRVHEIERAIDQRSDV